MQNIEIKAHYPHQQKGHQVALSLGGVHQGCDHQIDTYFQVPQGRLKLRQASLSGNFLIPYMRSNLTGPKMSAYTLLLSQEPEVAKRLLTEILGVDKVIEKHRDIYLIGNVRVHLDQVKDLGTFLEFEAVYEEASQEEQEKEKVQRLIAAFGIRPEDLIQGSYLEQSSLPVSNEVFEADSSF